MFYCHPLSTEGTAVITASAERANASIQIPVKRSEMRYVTGIVRSAKDSLPIENAVIVSHHELPAIFSLPTLVRTAADGRYILQEPGSDSLRIDIGREGYFGESSVLALRPDASFFTHILTPIAGGVLHGKTFVLDAALGGKETGTVANAGGKPLRASDMNLDIVRRLQQLLVASGARVVLVRKDDATMTVDDRLKSYGPIKEGVYLRVEVSQPNGKVGIFMDATAGRRKTLGPALQWGLAATLQRDTLTPQTGRTPLSDGVSFSVVSMLFPDVSDSMYLGSTAAAANRCAWSAYRGILKASGYVEDKNSVYVIPAGSLPALKKIVLDYSLVSFSEIDGSCTFYVASNSKHVVKILED
jgi:N-acetylmuramoyl-L-alanine amidase